MYNRLKTALLGVTALIGINQVAPEITAPIAGVVAAHAQDNTQPTIRREQRGQQTWEVRTKTTVTERTSVTRTDLRAGNIDNMRGVAGSTEGRGAAARGYERQVTLSEESYQASLELDKGRIVLNRDTANAERVLRTNGQFIFWQNADGTYSGVHGIIGARVEVDGGHDGYRNIWRKTFINNVVIPEGTDPRAYFEAEFTKRVRPVGRMATIGEIHVKVESDSNCVENCGPPAQVPAPTNIGITGTPRPPVQVAEVTNGLEVNVFAGATLPSDKTKVSRAETYIGANGNIDLLNIGGRNTWVSAGADVVAGKSGTNGSFNLETLNAGPQINFNLSPSNNTTGFIGARGGIFTAGSPLTGPNAAGFYNPAGNRTANGLASGERSVTGTGYAVRAGVTSDNFDITAQYARAGSEERHGQFTDLSLGANLRSGPVRASANVDRFNIDQPDGQANVRRTGMGGVLDVSFDLGGDNNQGLYVTGGASAGNARTNVTTLTNFDSTTNYVAGRAGVGYRDGGFDIRAVGSYGNQNIANNCGSCGTTREYRANDARAMLQASYTGGNPRGTRIVEKPASLIQWERMNPATSFNDLSNTPALSVFAEQCRVNGVGSDGAVMDNETCSILNDWAKAQGVNGNYNVNTVTVNYTTGRPARTLQLQPVRP